jgi:DHA2 family multidrug resistance protein
MNENLIIITGIIQGFGIGLVNVPLSTVAFGTLPAELRNEGTAFFNLLRNIGSAIGITAVGALMTQNTQIIHASLAEHVTPFNLNSPPFLYNHIDSHSHSGIAALNNMITNQAAMIAYLNDYKLMMVITIAVIPLLIFLRPPVQLQDKQERVVME